MAFKLSTKYAKTAKNKTAGAIALFLMATIALTLVALPTANAHYPAWEIPTWMYCTATPNPVGVNQQITIIYWCNWIPPTANGEYGDRWTFTLDITKPNGDKQTVGPITSDPIGGGYYPYTPDQVGNYTFVAHFVESVVTNAKPNPNPVSYNDSPYINDTFKASTSNTWTETVQEKQLTDLPDTPLPTNYWARPINAYNRNWNTIAGNWLSTIYPIVNGFQPFSTGPETAHIAWTKPFTTGGIAGGLTGVAANGGPTSYYTGSSYEIEWSGYPYTELTPIIMNGYLYYNVQDPPRYGWYAVDLRTGETTWFQNSTGPLQNGYGTGNSGNYPPTFGTVPSNSKSMEHV
jgi:hypothetical protein